jgi:hypothetical protein
MQPERKDDSDQISMYLASLRIAAASAAAPAQAVKMPTK